jgi:rubrerythrin
VTDPALAPGELAADFREELLLALRSEFGARSLYPWLARRTRKPELAAVLHELARDTEAQISQLRQLLAELSVDAPSRSRRRACASMIIAGLTVVLGSRFALRICVDAEETVARWYERFAHRFVAQGRVDLARRVEPWGLAKRRHADVLRTFLALSRPAGGDF